MCILKFSKKKKLYTCHASFNHPFANATSSWPASTHNERPTATLRRLASGSWFSMAKRNTRSKKKNTRGLAFGKLKRCVKKSIYSTENWPGDGCFPTNGCLSRVQHPPTKIHGSSWSPHGHGLCRIFFGLGDNLEKTKIRFGQWMNWLVYSRLVAQQIIRNQRPPATRWPIHTSNNRSPFPNSIQFQEFTNCTWTRTGQQIWTCSQSYLCWKKT